MTKYGSSDELFNYQKSALFPLLLALIIFYAVAEQAYESRGPGAHESRGTHRQR